MLGSVGLGVLYDVGYVFGYGEWIFGAAWAGGGLAVTLWKSEFWAATHGADAE